mgnify:CR=1 FL=1
MSAALVFSAMEDSGYLPRLAVMVNSTFRLIGLNGKAVLPMILGLGCDTMATLTTRILETPKEQEGDDRRNLDIVIRLSGKP